uniref:Uncharacterized protein n=1 Tax=Arundo donax TaxID=35708 RepID=A0A0A9AUW9_ARUDO
MCRNITCNLNPHHTLSIKRFKIHDLTHSNPNNARNPTAHIF